MRERDVMAALQVPRVGTAAVVARLLNLDAPCPWCPVEPPRQGSLCAVVPEMSRCRVDRVLRRLARKGLLQTFPIPRRLVYWLPTAG